MPGSPNKQLPRALGEARRAAALSQKKVALSAGVDPSYLCALERARRPPPSQELVDRLVAALGLVGDDASDVVWAAAHDRVLLQLATEGLGPTSDVISAALLAARTLSLEELRGLADLLRELSRSKRQLTKLIERASRSRREDAQ